MGLGSAKNAEIVAVGSRTRESAEVFGREFDIPNCHASYEALANDPEIDVIYIGTPHNYHKEHTILCLEAGKHVLCEKPLAINVGESRAMVELARARGLFLMEAMWTRFIPSTERIREIVTEGTLGEIRMFTADFGFRSEWDPRSRLLDPEYGGGSLLDVGIYPISFASMLLGTPKEITAIAHIGETKVDEQIGVMFGYEQGQIAQLHSAVRTESPQEATLMGTKGTLRIHSPFWRANEITLTVEGKSPEKITIPFVGNGYNYEADEVASCIRAGRVESAIMPLDESLSIMETLDTIRRDCDLRYPME